jgi:hypothetical protein
MNSLLRSSEYSRKDSIQTEIIVVLDRADKKTEEYFAEYMDPPFQIHHVDFGDLGLARNSGVLFSSGKYIAFLDADNLFGQDWLSKAFLFLEMSQRDIIVHPEYHVVFGRNNLIWHQISSSSPEFRFSNLIEFNYWDAVCVTKRDILLKYPYESTTQSLGFGFEDWHFNCQTLADGIEHIIVPGTVHFLRTKESGSLLEYSLQTHRLIRPSKLFDSTIFSAMLTEKNDSIHE